ncbi:MAG: NfeD family protein, partial [Pseudomonadota bacterium]
MAWWGWIIFGALLLGAELLGVDAAFYLFFIGAAAIFVGLLDLAELQLAVWQEWLLFAASAIVFMVVFRRRLYDKLRGDTPDYPSGPEGEQFKLDSGLEPGDTGRIRFRGTSWSVVNESSERIDSG